MWYIRAVSSALLIAGLVQSVLAATVFEDDFCTADNWVEMNILDAFITTSVDNCDLVARDSGLNIGILKHDMQLPGDFSYSVTFQPISSTYTRAGIVFNLNDQLSGYAFTISSQRKYQVSVMKNGISTPLSAYLSNPSILPTAANTLKVDRIGNEIHLSCNGNYLEKITDNTYTGGGIGLLVGTGTTVRFKNATVTNQPNPGSPVTCIAEDYHGAGIVPWDDEFIRGTYRIENGELLMSSSSAVYSAILFIRGSFEQASIKAVASDRQGSGLYGIGFVDIYHLTSGTPAYKTFGFLVNAQRQYASINPSASQFPLWGPSTHLRGQDDTLEMRYANGSYDLYANGNKLTTVPRPADFQMEAVGLILQPNASAAYGDFRGGDQTCLQAAVSVRSGHERVVKAAGNLVSRFYDVRGRVFSSSDKNRRSGAGKGFPSGVYFAVASPGTGGGVTRIAVPGTGHDGTPGRIRP